MTEEQDKQLMPYIQALALTEEQRKKLAEIAVNSWNAIGTSCTKAIRRMFPALQQIAELGYGYKNTKRFRWRNWAKARRMAERG